MDFGSEFGAVQSGRAFRNPGISLCHVAFRSAALLVYLFGGLFSSSFIGVFVAVVLLLSIDFWTVKNVTGRIMVSTKISTVRLGARLHFREKFSAFIIPSTKVIYFIKNCIGWLAVVELH